MNNNPFIIIHDIVEANGKTIKENNLDKKHGIPVGALVEVNFEDFKGNGIRLYVKKHTRDCDGTPLYSLGIPEDDYCNSHGYSEDCLTLIKPPAE
jgi:hypothetical protein